MKRFEFRLNRVLEFRREQAELELSRLQGLLAQRTRIDNEKQSLLAQVADARDQITRAASVSGEELLAMSGFDRHIRARTAVLDQALRETEHHVHKQQSIVMEADRKVALLLKLRQRRLASWTMEADRELEAFAAESYLSRLASAKNTRRISGG